MIFDIHIHEIHKKVIGILLFLNRVKDKFEAATRKTVAELLAISIINSCLPVYGTTNNTLMKRVQKLQNSTAKICAGEARRGDHATPFITLLNWLKIEQKVVLDVAVAVYKIKNKMYPEWFMQLSTNTEVTQSMYTTRQQDNLHVPYTNTDCGPWNMEYVTTTHHKRQLFTLFRKRLKTHLLNT